MQVKDRKRLPPWLKRPILANKNLAATEKLLKKLSLNTVCQSAKCPNRGECFSRKTATFMILGSQCTRNCRFCVVDSGDPELVDQGEPQRIVEAVEQLGLRYVVITSVTRDDLEDGGATHFVNVITALRESLPNILIEILTPDFNGDEDQVKKVVLAKPNVFNHNIETVKRLYPEVRPQADYSRSLKFLKYIKKVDPDMVTKSGMMVGLGEAEDEVIEALRDLRKVGCNLLTIGQYLRPSNAHYPVKEFIPPEQFSQYKKIAEELGFSGVASGPFVRSSYHADQYYNH